ncbi:hypothetical protein V8D89_001958 [Ganoderma adspersum]
MAPNFLMNDQSNAYYARRSAARSHSLRELIQGLEGSVPLALCGLDISPARSVGRTTAYASLFLVSTGLFAIYYFDFRAALHKYVVTPVIRHTLDAEAGHKLAVCVLGSRLAPRDPVADDDILKVELWGEELASPVGLAVGFDKHGEAIDGLFGLGFSWVEVGCVTPKPHPGNPKPRVFHLPNDSALINHYGFPFEGHTAVLSRLRARLPALFAYDSNPTTQSLLHGQEHASLYPDALLAVNLGKNKSSPLEPIDDFVAGVHVFGPYADALVVNVSSPNTPGLGGMQSRTVLQELLAGVTAARDDITALSTHSHRPKLLLKTAPDLSKSKVADVVVAGPSETGWMSGPPLKQLSLATLCTLRGLLSTKVPLIGCGGISSGADALEFARAGAAAVQLYTAFGYQGPGAMRAIKDELVDLLRKEGTTWREVVRKSVEQHSFREPPPPTLPPVTEPTVEVLHQEAEELKRLFDGLGEKIEESVESPSPTGNAQVDGSMDGATLGGDAGTERPATS